MDNLTLIANTRYLDDPVSQRRGELAVESLKNAQRLGVPIHISDWGSTNTKFLDAINSSAFDNVSFSSSEYCNYLDHIIKSLDHFQNEVSGEDMNFLRIELEKYGFIIPETLALIKGILEEDRTQTLEMIGFGCQNRKHMPDLQKVSEMQVCGEIKKALENQGVPVEDFSGEGPGSLLGPVLLTRKGIEGLLREDHEGLIGNTLFFKRKAQLTLCSTTDDTKILFHEVDFSYDLEKEMIPENHDTKILLNFFGFHYNKVGLEDFCKIFLHKKSRIMESGKMNEFQNLYPDNLALKRLRQYFEIGVVVCDQIDRFV